METQKEVVIKTVANLASFLIRINGADLALDTHIGDSDSCWVMVTYIDHWTEKTYEMFSKSSLTPLMYLRVNEGDKVYIMDNDATKPGEHGDQDYQLPKGNYLIGTSYGTLAVVGYKK